MSPKKTESRKSEPAMIRSAFERLPEEIIVQILRQSNPNGFASLILLNRRWRLASSQAYLYIHQLLQCSYSKTNKIPSIREDDCTNLPWLRRLFAREIKRNLFEAYLRPTLTTISLISNSSNQLPESERESFNYSLSPKGHYILADSSSRIHILDATGPEIIVKKGFKIIQRPALATITDDGHKLALFYTDLHVYIYDLSNELPKKIRAILLDHSPRTIALSPNGSVLAAAYDSGIELSSLNPTNLSTDRRSVKCYTVDSLSFSRDGTQMLGTTVHSQSPSTVVLTAPYFDTGATHPEDSISALWTTSILFPNGSRDCSHAVLLPSSSEEEANWAFAYDRAFETFRAVRIDDLRNGTTHFTGPVPDPSLGSSLLPSSLPAVNKSGELVVSGFRGYIWLYGIPEDLDAILDSKNGSNNFTESAAQTSLNQISQDGRTILLKSSNKNPEDILKIPQWQLLCDSTRNNFVGGRNIAFLESVSKMAWVDSPTFLCGDRLIAVASGVGSYPLAEVNSSIPVNEGRIIILDFNHSPVNGKKKTITLEVDMNEAQTLDSENHNLEAEATRIRMRTSTQQQSTFSNVVEQDSLDSPTSLSQRGSNPQLNIESDVTSLEEDTFDAPYSHTNPRSGSTLRRAATAAAANRRFNSQSFSNSHIFEYRRADGREEYPHESDADDWVPPPPPYSLKSTTEFSGHIERTILETNSPTLHGILDSDIPDTDTDISCEAQNTLSVAESHTGENSSLVRAHNSQDTHSSEQVYSESRELQPLERALSNDEFDDRYDVSPPGSPLPESRQSNLVTRQPVSISQESPFDGSPFLTNSISQSEVFLPTDSRHYNLSTELSMPKIEKYGQPHDKTNETENPLDIRSAHSEDLPLDDNFRYNSQRPNTINSQNSTPKFQIREDRLSLRLPFSNKIASVTKVLRDQRPRLSRRITAPGSVGLGTSVTGRLNNLSNYQNSSRVNESPCSVNNIDQSQGRKERGNTPISIHQSSQSTSSCQDPIHYSVPEVAHEFRCAPLSSYPSITSSYFQNSNAVTFHAEKAEGNLENRQSSIHNPENFYNESSKIFSIKPTCDTISATRHNEREAAKLDFQGNQNTTSTVAGIITENELIDFDKRKHIIRNREFKEKHCEIM